MARITGLLCQVITGNLSGAGTDGSIFLGIGGREFCLDSEADDFERNSWREYVLGRAPLEPQLPSPQIRVKNASQNDPRRLYPLDTNFLNRAPVYLRFEPNSASDNWNLGFATVLVYTGASDFYGAFMPPNDFDYLWLGRNYGKILYFVQEWREGIQPVLDTVRRFSEKKLAE